MKKTIIAMIATILTFTLCACGTETTGSMTITETGTEQTVKQNISTEQTNSEEPNTEKQNLADTSSNIDPSWKDVAELVNLKGDETTVYLLADGRYMDRTDTVYIFDGVDTWTDESGVEWNEVVK